MLTRRQLWALLALTLLWGVNWPMMKLSLSELTPMYFRALTMTGGAAWLYLFFRLRGIRMTPHGTEWRQVLLLALPNMLGWHLLSILALKELASGRAAILGFTMPVWTVLISVLVLGERLTGRIALAVAAVAAAIGLLVHDEIGTLAGQPLGVLWIQLAALCWSVGTLLMQRTRHTLPIEALTVWMMLCTASCFWLIAALTEPLPTLQFSLPVWLSLVFGVLINYGVAQILWFGLARKLPATTSGMSLMAIPLIGTLSAPLIVQEWPRWQDFAAMLFVMIAMAAVLLPPGFLRRPSFPWSHRP